MEQEYTISTGMKVLYGVLAAIFFVFAGFVSNMHKAPEVSAAVYIIPLVIFAVGLLILINIVRRKVIIYDGRITCTGIFSTSELAIADIKGYKILQNKNNKSIILESMLNGGSKLRIGNCSDLTDSAGLMQWVTSNFINLDVVDLKNEQEAVLNDTTIGFTQEEREQTLQRAKTVAKVYNIAGAIVSLATLFFYNQLSVVILMIIPLIGFVVLITSKKLIRFFSNPKRSIYPSVILGFIVPCFVLFVKSVAGFHILNLSNIWLPGLTVTGIMFVILLAIGLNKASMAVAGQVVLMLLLTAFYGFGSVLQVNCVFDQSVPQVYKATVLDHRVSHGKSTSYYLMLSKWGPEEKAKETDVSRRLYNDAAIGDTVTIYLKSGKLDIPWYTIYK